MSVFVFGTKIFPETKRDAISSLPLELSWKIFSYLEDRTLCIACRVCKIWERIILSDSYSRRRLNHFDLAIKFGSYKKAMEYIVHKKVKRKRNFLELNKCLVSSSQPTMMKSKRSNENTFVCSKRYRLF